MAKVMTHTGFEVAANSCVDKDFRRPVKLRATANFWVSDNGLKYRKETGHRVGDIYAAIRLDLTSIKPIV